LTPGGRGPSRGPRRRSAQASVEPNVRLQRRRRNRRRLQQRKRRRIGILLAALAILVFVLLPGGGVTAAGVMCSNVDLNSLRQVEIGENSFLYAADGSFLGTIPAEKNRQPVELDEVSSLMPKATIAIEDRRFYAHEGIDVEGIARAAVKNLSAKRIVEGGSTITQQLVRNLYPVSRERTIERKLKEACLAIKLDRAWSKDRILTGYMNHVYYGNHAYGVEAAARTYFSKRARNLNLDQAALLAGLTQAPTQYDPFTQPERALARRNAVLRAMLETDAITEEQYRKAIAREVNLRPGRLYKRINEPYFFSYVYNELVREYGGATVRSGGLRVYTTIDRRLQRAAQKAIRNTLYLKDDPASALVSINPRTGAIRAMTSVTPGRARNQFNLAAQARRQAGSTFKTFVLTAAIERGVNPDSTSYISAPFKYQPDPLSPAWEVSTYGHDYYGYSSITSATLRSDNTVYAQLTLDLEPEAVAATARKMGVTVPDNEVVPSLGLGAISVSPLEMAAAYATLAAGGVYSEPMAIKRVVLPGGNEDEGPGWGKPKRKRVLQDWVADEVTEILEDNMHSGTGTGAYFGRTAAGKTGTTENHADAWFAGYTPTLQTTVWVGYPQAQIPMENVHGISVAGGTFPAQIWRLFMQEALMNVGLFDWPEPRGEPEWRDFDQGQYAVEYVPQPPTTTTDAEKPKRSPKPSEVPVEEPPVEVEPPPTPPPPEPAPPVEPPPTEPGLPQP
jgi:penicillin-binding protein 1A